MRRALGIGLAMLLAAPFAASAAPITIELKVAKTQQRAFALGSIDPARPSQRIRVRLAQDTGEGFVRVATKFARLSSESTYDVGFPRPTEGQCRFVVVYLRGSRPSGAEVFPCAIPEFGTGTATITSDAGVKEVDLEIAETPEQQGYGLMYRRWLAADKGMVFLFAEDTTASFYMKNTLIPLSVAFFDSADQILEIVDMAPCDEEPCPLYGPGVPYRGALEVNQGAFTTWGVTEGDIITITRD